MTIQSLYRWNILPPMPFSVMTELQNYSRVQQKLLFNRDITTIRQANAYMLPSPLTDPFKLKTMHNAVITVLSVIDAGKPIVVYGDYDVDGVTASSLLVQVLRTLGADVSGYIPNRFEEGYGVNAGAIETLAKSGTALTITVDCGIRSPSEVALASSLGMDMIITDHHEPGDVIPEAAAVINPKQPGDEYPEKNLAGVGIAYKLASALLHARPLRNIKAEDWLDLVAIGSVADMVPLNGENRHLVRAGLERLRKTSKPAIRALAKVSGVEPHKISSQTIGFNFGPRLNAAGRLETAMLSFNLLMSETDDEAMQYAIELNDYNRQRQELTESLQSAVMASIDTTDIPPIIFAADPSYNMGIVGLAASRITERLNRPAIVGAITDDEIRASCRSISEFSIIDSLDECADLFVKHGGHHMAAGFTIKTKNWEELQERLTAIASEQLEGRDIRPIKNVEGELDLAYCTMNTANEILALEPYGVGNPEPLFILKDAVVNNVQLIGKDATHLRMEVANGRSEKTKSSVNAIAFRQAHRAPAIGDRIDLLFALDVNEFRGVRSVQLRVTDFRSAISD